MKKKRQLVITINFNEDGTISDWATGFKGEFKGIDLSNIEFSELFKYLQKHYLASERVERSHKKFQEDMEKHPEDYVDILIPDEISTSHKDDLGEITEVRCGFCSNFLYTLKSDDTYYYCTECFLSQHKNYLLK